MLSCDYCPLKFEEQEELDNHIQVCNAKKSSILRKFKQQQEILVKTRDEEPVIVPLFSCKHCFDIFKSVIELFEHIQICNARIHRYATVLPSCVSCFQQFYSLEDLNNHISQCPRRSDSYVCPDCGDSFWTRHEFQAHFHSYCRREKRQRWQ
ncbi:zinc finger and BTB domain-containing protein 48-like [Pseudomyrmex gracilis]|uniref:zinc finger and BTB domain-containing protein 48-like n=1 Tax=Pseudomyrmex gracilis TaxID=219809 RepID=UPI00099507FC|nr:zinc finger and BTB domain-containing protein 48-like [Pseudomyrmex gracilis]